VHIRIAAGAFPDWGFSTTGAEITTRFRKGQSACNHSLVRDCDVAQAVELIRALKQQLHEMTTQLAWVERHGFTDATRLEAAALRRDIQEAQFLIDGLRRRYLNGDEHTRQHPVGRRPLAMVGRQPGD
jgi:hypothetical protein